MKTKVSSTKQINVGILGTGNIASQMADTLSRMTEARLYGCASRTKEKADRFATKYQATRSYGSYEELAKDSDIDLVYIATPHLYHCENTLLCIENNKAVLCEKPFALNYAQAFRMIESAKTKNVLLADAMWMRYQPLAKQIRKLAWSGIIGDPVYLSANKGELNLLGTSDSVVDLGSSALLGLGIYAINNAFLAFGSDVLTVSSNAIMTADGTDGINAVILTYAENRMAVVTSSQICPMDNTWFICGTRGMMEIQGLSRILKIRIFDHAKKLIQDIDAPPMDTGYEYEIQSCCDAIQDGRIECSEMPHAETLQIMKLIDRLRESWMSQKKS